MQDETNDAIDALHAMLDRAATIVAFTGAGISTESGVPDFRTPGSPWMVNKPIPFQAFTASREARIEAWRRKFAMDDHFAGAGPNRGHRALARLIAQGRSPGLEARARRPARLDGPCRPAARTRSRRVVHPD